MQTILAHCLISKFVKGVLSELFQVQTLQRLAKKFNLKLPSIVVYGMNRQQIKVWCIFGLSYVFCISGGEQAKAQTLLLFLSCVQCEHFEICRPIVQKYSAFVQCSDWHSSEYISTTLRLPFRVIKTSAKYFAHAGSAEYMCISVPFCVIKRSTEFCSILQYFAVFFRILHIHTVLSSEYMCILVPFCVIKRSTDSA